MIEEYEKYPNNDISKLIFYYPQEGGESVARKLVFLENIAIQESRKTKYTQYTPLGNNGNFFVFMGSESRQFKLSFNLTLPHIMRTIPVKELPKKSLTSITKQDYFVNSKYDFESEKKHEVSLNDYISKFDERSRPSASLLSELGISIEEFNSDMYSNTGIRKRALWQVLYCINLIRTSVMTHSKRSYLGPPIARLSHGILYDNVPCIVENYNIAHDEPSGYDKETLLPNVLKVRMDLTEVRIRGRNFSPKESGDFVPGWDSIVEDGFSTIDPTHS